MSSTSEEKPKKARGHLLGGLALLSGGHLIAFILLRPDWYAGWAVYLALVQFIYVLPLSFLVRRMGWAATWLGLWFGALFTLLLPIILWVGQWMSRGGKIGVAGL